MRSTRGLRPVESVGGCVRRAVLGLLFLWVSLVGVSSQAAAQIIATTPGDGAFGFLAGAPYLAEARVGGNFEVRLGAPFNPVDEQFADFMLPAAGSSPFELEFLPGQGVLEFTIGEGSSIATTVYPVSSTPVIDALLLRIQVRNTIGSLEIRDLALTISAAVAQNPISSTTARAVLTTGSGQDTAVIQLSAQGLSSGFRLTGRLVSLYDPASTAGAVDPRLQFQIWAADIAPQGASMVADADYDGILDADDNCPFVANPDQADSEFNGLGDGVGDACDNCPDTFNSDQADSDTDDVGDACDNCGPFTAVAPGDPRINAIPNSNQFDSDQDGVGDACDNCVVNPNPSQSDADLDGRGDSCEPSEIALDTGLPQPLTAPATAASASAPPSPIGHGPSVSVHHVESPTHSVGSPTSGGAQPALISGTPFQLRLTCGPRDLSRLNISVRANPGALFDFAECATAPGPGALEALPLFTCDNATIATGLGATVDPLTSFVVGPNAVSTAGGGPIESDAFIISLAGNQGSDGTLCTANQTALDLGTLVVGNLLTSVTIGTEGLDVLGLPQLEESTGTTVPATDVLTSVGASEADAQLTLAFSPSVDDVTGFRRWQLTIESNLLIGGLVFGMQPVGDDPETVLTFPDLGPGVDLPGSGSLTVVPLGDDPATRTRYVKLSGFFDNFPDDPSLNQPGSSSLLGVLEFDLPPTDPTSIPPSITFVGVENFPGEVPITLADGGVAPSTDVVRLVVGFDQEDDTDSDGIGDDSDNCVNAANFPQVDTGQVANLGSDGIGNVCQCGDSTGDGPVDSGALSGQDDIAFCARLLAGEPPPPGDPGAVERCSVTGGTEIDISDLLQLQRRLSGAAAAGDEINQVCQPAVAPTI